MGLAKTAYEEWDEAQEITVVFTKKELYEINDAVGEVIGRMCHIGQTQAEIDNASLSVMWEVKQKATQAVLGAGAAAANARDEGEIRDAIAHPILLKAFDEEEV